jgi:uncharacterized membrane protein (DUF4010 family)
LIAGLILTSSVAFLRALVEISVINMQVFLMLLIPIAAIAIVGGFFIFFLQSKNKSTPESMTFENPFQLRSALGFGLFFVLIAFLAKVSNIFFGTQGLYITSLVAGLADIDAISISVSQLANASAITTTQAMIAIMLALISNLWVKFSIVSVFAQQTLRKVMLLYTVIITLTAVSLSFLLHFLISY